MERTHRARILGLGLLCAIAFLASESSRYGDSLIYAKDIAAGNLIEPGHLLWRPLGSLAATIAGAQHDLSTTLWVLQTMSLIAGVACVVVTYLLLARYCSVPVAVSGAVLLGLSNGFWSYAFSGASYSLGVLFLLLACTHAYPGPANGHRRFAPLLTGLYVGLAASTWGILALAAPALWLAFVLKPTSFEHRLRSLSQATASMAAGGLVTFAVPLAVAYGLRSGFDVSAHLLPGHAGVLHGGVGVPNPPGVAETPFFEWLKSSSHHIPMRPGLGNAARVFAGWPNSFVSVGPLRDNLRSFYLGERMLPVSLWMVSLAGFYATVGWLLWTIWRQRRAWSAAERGVLTSCLAGIAMNMLFAFLWQGFDLERYFPSLPFTVLLFAVVLNRVLGPDGVGGKSLVASALVLMIIANLGGSIHTPVSKFPMQVWKRTLAQHTTGADLVLIIGKENFGVESPHSADFPRVINLTSLVIGQGDHWQAALTDAIRETHRRGGRVFVSDLLLRTDWGPRDGHSFREFPKPTPDDLVRYFASLKSDTVAFEVRGEAIWLGNYQ